MRDVRQLLTVVLCATVFLWTSSASAGGFAILEQSAEGVGNAFAGASAGYGDGSEVSFNSAAMAWLEGTTLTHSSHLILPSSEFTDRGSRSLNTGIPTAGNDGGNGGENAYVPNVYVVHQVMEELHLGLGVNAPFGLETDYRDGWVGRYHALNSELQTVNINPAVSYRVADDISIGGGVNIMYADAKLTNAIDFGTIGVGTLGLPTASSLGLLPQQADGKVKVEGDDWGVGYNLGAAWQYDNNGSRIGLSYHSKVDVDIEGDGDFTVPSNASALTSTGLFTDASAVASITLPEYVNFGVIHQLDEQWALLGEVQWTRWDRLDELRVEFDSSQPDAVTDLQWDNTWRWSVGANYKATEELTLRSGFTYDQSPIPSSSNRTPRIPGNHRKWLALGMNYDFTDEISGTLSYAHLFISDTDTNVTNSTGDNLVGDWDLAVDIISIGVNWQFG